MKKIDWYIFKRYLITFTAMLFMFIPIGIIIDVSEKINRMIENKVAIKDVLVYYYGNLDSKIKGNQKTFNISKIGFNVINCTFPYL